MDAIAENHDFLSTYSFTVYIGELTAGFSSITNIERAIEYDTIQEGGVNDYVHTWPKPVSQQHRLVFEKGAMRANPFFTEKGGVKVIKLGQRFEWGTILINTPGVDSTTRRIYTFDNPVVVRWEVTSLSGSDASVLIDRLEVVHDGLDLMWNE